MSKYKAVFSDLDGTLLDEEGKVRPSARAVVAQLRARGIAFFVSTGRSVCAALGAVGDLGLDTPFICYNGAVVYDPRSGAWLRHETINDRVTAELLDVAEAHALFYLVFHEDTKLTLPPRFDYQSEFYGRLENLRHVSRFEDLPRRGITKFSIYTKEDEGDQVLLDHLENTSDDHYVERFWLNTIPGFRDFAFRTTDVHARAGGKGAGLRFVMQRYGIDRTETIAIGDHMNDLSMLEEAGLAVAVGNSLPLLTAAADHVIPHANGDGVARFLSETFDL